MIVNDIFCFVSGHAVIIFWGAHSQSYTSIAEVIHTSIWQFCEVITNHGACLVTQSCLWKGKHTVISLDEWFFVVNEKNPFQRQVQTCWTILIESIDSMKIGSAFFFLRNMNSFWPQTTGHFDQCRQAICIFRQRFIEPGGGLWREHI